MMHHRRPVDELALSTPLETGSDILVVDDTSSNLLAVEVALGPLAARVVRAQSGAEALKKLLSRDFSLILLDVQMPDLDGYQTARLIRQRERSRTTPIIFVTAYSKDNAEVLQAYGLGAVDFLFKPIVPEVLRAKASVFVDLHRQSLLIREHERREHEQRLLEERRRWEEQAMQVQVEKEREVASALAQKAAQLAASVRSLESAERELTRINSELAEADRRKDEFLAMLAHELRNPLAPIVTSLELLKLQFESQADPTVVKARDTMDRQVSHLRRLVDDLLDISRINTGRIALLTARANVLEIIEHAVSTSRPVIDEREHSLSVDVPDEPVFVEGDAVRLAQVLSNLLNNAARYTPKGGRVELQCVTSGSEVVVSVRDNGQGIAAELLEEIFELFVQQRRGDEGGLGLGLTLAKRLVELHGGSIGAESAGLGQGSTFTVRLPRSTTAHESVHPAASVVSSLGPLHVVLVEDNTDIRETVSTLLRDWGHRVDVAGDGQRGLDLIVTHKPDVAIVDIGLPGLDGYEVAIGVRSALGDSSPRLIAMTGFGQPSDRQRAMDAGFDLHLTKPATAQALRSALAVAPRADAD